MSIIIETSLNKDIVASCEDNASNYKLIKVVVDILQSLDNRNTTFTIIRNIKEETS